MAVIRMLSMVLRRPGLASAVALSAGGVGIALDPRRAGDLMHAPPMSARGVTEVRAGLGGTFAALGAWAARRGSEDAYTAVGVTWLGAAAVRMISMRTDNPERDWTFWAFLAGETVFGIAGLLDRGSR
jgi:hypothetical protein